MVIILTMLVNAPTVVLPLVFVSLKKLLHNACVIRLGVTLSRRQDKTTGASLKFHPLTRAHKLKKMVHMMSMMHQNAKVAAQILRCALELIIKLYVRLLKL